MRKLFSGIVLALVMLIVIALPAYAIDPPVSKTLVSQKVFRNLAEDGDMLIVFHWNWAFSDNYSSTPASDSIIYRLYDTDGSTLLSTDTPYVFSLIETNGYGNNVGSFYFNAADNTTWGDAYVINIYGTPAFFSPAQTFSYTLTSADYITEDDQVDTRNELFAYIMLLADRFDSLYDVELKTTSDSGIILSSYGELFFRGAIPGLQTLCPQLFFTQVYVPEAMTVTPYDLFLQTTYTERLTGTDLDKGFTRLGELMGGMSKGFAAGIVFLGLMAFLVFWCVKKGWGIEVGAAISIPVGIAAALIVGDVLFTILMIAALLAAMGIFYLVTFKRA